MTSSAEKPGDQPSEEDSQDQAASQRQWRIQATQQLQLVQQAIRSGKVRFPEAETVHAREIMALNLLPGQLISQDQLSPEALGLLRTLAMALAHTPREGGGGRDEGATGIRLAEGQTELFGHFSEVFIAFAGKPHHAFATENELMQEIVRRANARPTEVERACQRSLKGLGSFYEANARAIWKHARDLGGLKLVLGGQRQFGPSAFAGLRAMALYADTQLVADPIYPFFERDLELAATSVELVRQLYRLLQLTPLIEAGLPVPPVLVFPSFEKVLEDADVQTQTGIWDLVLQAVGVACGASFSDPEDLVAFTRTHSDQFVAGVMREQLFLPPHVAPGEINDPRLAVERYITEVGTYRRPDSVHALASLPLPTILMTGIMERFAPQYHLLENARELVAQPMLTQRPHWHFFEKTSVASAAELHRKDILSEASLAAIRALQDARLVWLGDIPIPVLAKLLERQENLSFRKELVEHTERLSAAGSTDLDQVVREVCHGVNVMIQSHGKAIGDIEARYASRHANTWVRGGTGFAVSAGAMFLPVLSALGPAPPLVAGATLLGAFGVNALNRKMELRRARSSLMGVLAAASPEHGP